MTQIAERNNVEIHRNELNISFIVPDDGERIIFAPDSYV